MIIRSRKIDDKKLVGLLNELFQLLDSPRVTGEYFGGAAFGASNPTELKNISSKANELLIQSFVLKSGQHSDEVRFARGVSRIKDAANPQQEYSDFINSRNADAYFDEFAFFELPNRKQIGGYRAFEDATKMAISRKLLKLSSPLRAVKPEVAKGFDLLLSQHLADLQQATTEFLARTAEARQEDEAALSARLAKLEEDYNSKSEAIKKEAASLERQRKELNDREPQHERRRLREVLTNNITELLTNPTKKSRFHGNIASLLFAVSGICLIGISLMLTGDLGSFFEIGSSGQSVPTEAFWIQGLKSIAAGAAGGTFLWAGLSGVKKSEELEKVDYRRLQRYAHDMDRASWVVETLLQLSATESAQVPDVWLEAVCNELFHDDSNSGSHQAESLEALGALLDATTRAKVGTDGFQFELDRKKTRALAKQAQ